MTPSELKILELLQDHLVKFPHPITPLNAKEWNQISEVKIGNDKVIRIRSEHSAWFRLDASQVKKKAITYQVLWFGSEEARLGTREAANLYISAMVKAHNYDPDYYEIKEVLT